MAKSNQHPLVVKVRDQCLKRGSCGIKGFSKTFRLYDDDGDLLLTYAEMKSGLTDYGVTLTEAEYKELFNVFDKDGNGNVSFDEFLTAIRPPMSNARLDIIKKAYAKFDRTADGKVTTKDLKGVYKCRDHPKFQNGEWTETRVFEEFLKAYDSDGDSQVTLQEFVNYYSGVSASIDSDAYFDLMMRQCWKI